MDLVIYNSEVITLDNEARVCEAVAVKNGQIAAVGPSSDILNEVGPDTTVLNAKGGALIPGMTDTHAHMDREGLKSLPHSLTGIGSIRGVKEKIREIARHATPGNWIITGPIGVPPLYPGEPESALSEGRLPNRHDLDEVAPDNPVYIRPPWGYWKSASDKSLLVSIANTEALERSGLRAKSCPSFPGIFIEKDAYGELTGVIREMGPVVSADILLMSAESWFDLEDRVKALKISMEDYLSVGTTAVFEAHGVSPDVVRAYRCLHDTDRIIVRSHLVAGPVWADYDIKGVGDQLRDWYAWASGRGLGDEWFRIAGVFGRSGNTDRERLLSRYSQYTGMAGYTHGSSMTPELFHEFVVEAARLGIRVSTLFSDALDFYSDADAAAPISELRWVVGHIGRMSMDQVRKARDLGVGITLHTNRSIGDANAGDREILEKEHENEIVPCRSLERHGVPYGISTDNNPISLFRPIWHLISRKQTSGRRAIAPDHALSRYEALRVATLGGAWFTFDEGRRGIIEPGRTADFSILDKSPLKCDVDEIPYIKSTLTIVGGEIRYKRQTEADHRCEPSSQ